MKRKKKSNFRGKVSSNVKKQRQAENSYGYLNLPKGISVYKPKPGSRAYIDIIPYTVSDLKHLDKDEENNVAMIGDLWYKKPFKIHRSVGVNNESVVCPTTFGKKCPICEYRKKRQSEGADKEEIKALYPSRRNLYAVIPLKDKENDEKIHIWDVSWYLFQKLLDDEVEENEDYEVFPDIEEGLTLKIRFDSKQFGKGKPYPEASRIDFIERDNQYDEDILDDVPDLDKVLKVLSYKELNALFFEMEEDDIAEEEKEENILEEEEEKKPIRHKKKIIEDEEDEKDEEDDDEEDNEDEDEEEIERKPVRRKKKIIEEEEKEEKKEKLKKAKRYKKSIKEKEEDISKEKEGKCPFGHEFGKDCDTYEDCDDCPKWDDCFDASEE